MRPCPICGSSARSVVVNGYNRTGEADVDLCACVECGHRYVDAKDLTQAWLDDYYLHRYTTDDKPYSDQRLNDLAACIASYQPIEVLDIGGMDGELAERIRARGVYCRVAGVGTETMGRFDAVVLSHTLEHIYDMPAMMERIKAALKPDGLLFIEGPVHFGYADPLTYDNHWQHVNKFRPDDIPALLLGHGFKGVKTVKIDDYREYKCCRTVGLYASR